MDTTIIYYTIIIQVTLINVYILYYYFVYKRRRSYENEYIVDNIKESYYRIEKTIDRFREETRYLFDVFEKQDFRSFFKNFEKFDYYINSLDKLQQEQRYITRDISKQLNIQIHEQFQNLSKNFEHVLIDDIRYSQKDLVESVSKKLDGLVKTTSNDLTNKDKILFDDIEKKIRHISSVVSDVSHVMKTPISGLKLACKLISDNDGRVTSEIISDINTSIEHLENTFDSYSKLGKTSEEIEEMSHINLLTSLKQTLRILALSIDKKVNYEFQINKDITITKTLFTSLLVPINCIVENAFDAVQDNGIIKISVTAKDGNFELRIYNNGPKIEKQNGNIYERGFSSKNSTGLGLDIAKRILTEKLNGSLSHKNEKKGGVSFIIKFKVNNDGE